MLACICASVVLLAYNICASVRIRECVHECVCVTVRACIHVPVTPAFTFDRGLLAFFVILLK